MYSEKEFTRVQPHHSTRGCKSEEVGNPPYLSASIFAGLGACLRVVNNNAQAIE